MYYIFYIYIYIYILLSSTQTSQCVHCVLLQFFLLLVNIYRLRENVRQLETLLSQSEDSLEKLDHEHMLASRVRKIG